MKESQINHVLTRVKFNYDIIIYINNLCITEKDMFKNKHFQYGDIKFQRFKIKSYFENYIKHFINNGLEFIVINNEGMFYITNSRVSGINKEDIELEFVKFVNRLLKFDISLYNLYAIT